MVKVQAIIRGFLGRKRAWREYFSRLAMEHAGAKEVLCVVVGFGVIDGITRGDEARLGVYVRGADRTTSTSHGLGVGARLLHPPRMSRAHIFRESFLEFSTEREEY